MSKDKQKMTAMRWFYSYLKGYKWYMIIGMVLVTIASVLAIINPKITGYIVDDIIGDGSNIKIGLLPKFLILMLVVTLIRAVVRVAFQWLFESASQGMLYDMRDGVYRSLLQKDFAFYNKNRTGDLMSRQTGDMMAIRHFVSYVIFNIYESILLFCIALFMIFSVDMRIAFAMIAALPITGLITYLQSKAIKPKFATVRERFSSLNAFAQENISGNRVVKAFAKEDYEIEKFQKENKGYRDSEIEATNVWVRYVPLFEFLSSTLVFILMILGGIMCIKGDMSLGDMVMINSYLWMLNNPLRMAGWIVNDVFRFSTSVDKIYATISEEPDIMTPRYPEDVMRITGGVEFKNVSYNLHDDAILKDINFKVEAGQTVGIIGATGSGKSTIMNLICRFYDPTDGEVLVEGIEKVKRDDGTIDEKLVPDINVKNIDLHTLRDGIGMAMQDVFLFSDTIEGNIAYGQPDCPFERVEWAAKVANADEFIRQMPDGYDTIVGERGVGLSGGQRQRISLARALLKSPSIIILDDTTSAVDMETEEHIQNALRSLENKETVFIIAHRISSIKDADVILVLDRGRIVEMGTHNELVDMKGYYYTVFTHQYGEFNSEGR